MSPFRTELFFSLEAFAHKKIFHLGEFAWSPLQHLKKYLDAFKEHRIEIEIPEGVHLKNRESISIGAGTLIEPGVLIQGPCIIGKNCIIRHGAYLREYMLMGDGSVVGHSSELKHSILLNGAAVTHFVYVGDSIIGSGANLSAGVKCANLRLDRKEVSISFGEEKFQTGLKKLGAIVGDRVQIGCNCVLNPGTLIGADSVCHPLLNIGGYIPARSRVKGPLSFEIEPSNDPKIILQEMGKLERKVGPK